MISSFSLLFLPILAFAQQQAPPEVDQELRARVTAFYQNFVDGTPRKAEPFIAEDTKEYFYNAGKSNYKSFTVGKITFSDNFTKATVMVVAKQDKLIGGQVVLMDSPALTRWKIENGKWCWTFDASEVTVTPMGGVNPPRDTDPKSAGVKPRDTSPAAVRSAGLAVLNQQAMGLDKSSVILEADRAGSAQVIFTNNAEGEIQIALDGPVVRGLTVKLEKTTVPPAQHVCFVVQI